MYMRVVSVTGSTVCDTVIAVLFLRALWRFLKCMTVTSRSAQVRLRVL